ncbi:MAG: hypothetical protein P8103_02240 [Candidatus Thiodiazotropha sp.]
MTRSVEHDPHRLIEPLTADTAPRATSGRSLETAFLVGQCGLHFEIRARARELKAHFAHAIARNPGDLRLHVQRLLLHADTRDPAILGALCDLYQVLKDRGAPLRRRMLALARPLLCRIDHQALRQRLEKGTQVNTPSPSRIQEAVLDTGITGTTRLINKQSPQQLPGEDPLDSARQQLEYGQTELARETLERAVRQDPARLNLHLALLEIYRHLRDRHHVEAVWQSLQGMQNPAATEWRRLLNQLEEQA